MQSNPGKKKIATLNNQSDDIGEVVSIMYLTERERLKKRVGVLLIPKMSLSR